MAKTKGGSASKAGPNGMKRKGTSGSATNYITRNQALKKLQVSLSDFRRLCILKGIYPREPRNKKKANKGSTAPTTFYYSKDIAYLLHEPVLHKLREHKAFAKKLARALGRGQDGLAKNLEARHEGYRLDHIIKERYPTFADSVRDLDDALSLIGLFANLPSSPQVPPAVIANCARLAAEWQLYVMRSRSLRKVFLSVKGIYFQAEVAGQKVTWLVPYAFTQNVPPDVDFRIMLTFLELYQTLLGFVFFKLFTDLSLVYPLKVDVAKDEAGAGIGALLLEESSATLTSNLVSTEPVVNDGASAEAPRTKVKDVKRQIRAIAAAPASKDGDVEVFEADDQAPVDDASPDEESSLFSAYVFFLSREVTRPVLEFVVRSFGGRVGWDPILGAGSPYEESDARITHHVVDRPVAADYYASLHPGKRAYIQPQWVVDSVNLRRLLPTDEYAPGKTLPPHLSPFVDEAEMAEAGTYVPEAARLEAATEAPAVEPIDEEPDAFDDEEEIFVPEEDEAVEALPAGEPPKMSKKDRELAEIMLSGKQRKLYQKVARSHERKLEEKAKLQAKKQKLGQGRKGRS